ncbi:MAG TPA: error-prone DNA polymerase [Vicinamibacterales bacterium]|nr:error-prone DNA polymerase [Vicinamibacterales bacterium]
MYVELHTASAFSFLQGASLPEALVDRAAELGYPALALLDRDGVSGLPRFHKAATAAGLRAIVGAELTIEAGGTDRPVGTVGKDLARAKREPSPPGPRAHQSHPSFLLPVLCENAQGYQNLCRLITRMKMRAPKGEGALRLEEFDGATSGLVALAGRAALDGRRYGVGGLVDRLVGLFGRGSVYVELQRHLRRDEERDNAALASLAAAFRVPTIATNGVRFATAAARPLFDVLTCIHHHTDLASAGRRLAPNAERYLKPPADMVALFRDHPDAVARTAELADRLRYTMADLGYRFPDYPVPAGETQTSFLRNIVDVGARERYRPYHDKARAQIARELDLIAKLELAGYFLIVWDIVNFCRQHDILVQGRGSAANSAVCYSLGITAVDPVGMDLLFERFLSEERGEWPDIDLDLPSGDRREQVIQHVYEKYGRLGAAMTANVITYRGRSAAREVGKTLGFDPAQIDRLAKVMNSFEFIDPGDSLPRQMSSVGLDLNSDRVRLFARLWHQMLDLPRHLGQHSGGMVICQGRLDTVVPLENATMPGRVVVQWDKDDCAEMGIVKVDLLGLGMMAVIQDSLALVNGGKATAEITEITETGLEKEKAFSADSVRSAVASRDLVDLAHLPENDPVVYKMLCEADTIGVFQVESRAQMATLPRLRPKQFYDIVVQVAIIRPGPIVGQMVHPYLNRRAGREAVRYAHPSLEPILARTLGVPLFQEQLLRIAMVAAGFTGGQAEELRRAFGFKRSERRMKQIEVQLRDGMARQGITGEAAEQIITSITSFALYGFPESHAASFALLAYASAYLKAHFPAAFYTALLNNQPMGFYHPSTLVKDAQRRGVRFHPIDVQISGWDCTVEPDGGIRLGLRYVSGLREDIGRRIESADRVRSANAFALRRAATSTDGLNANASANNRSAKASAERSVCPKCGCDDESMIEREDSRWFCNNCSHDWTVTPRRAKASAERAPRFVSLDDLVARTGLRRDELVTLADVGALNTFGYDRRSALWQAERAVRPGGELFGEGAEEEATTEITELTEICFDNAPSPDSEAPCPLKPMTEAERLVADYAGMGLSTGRHPMALKRDELAMRGILRACDLRTARQGRRVRVAGMVITRQRPGTAKGFVFLTLEDETGIANIIVRPDLFARDRLVVVEEPFLIVDGVLQHQDGVISVRAEQIQGMRGVDVDFDAHDFY